jgi:2-hydroxycyclohexanecarboxyl-CoA dehydrogenase
VSRLKGKIVLVTGGGQGIGRGIALALASEGAQVAVSGRRREPLDAVVEEITERGGQALAVEGDVGVRADAAAMVAATAEAYGGLDALVNNAQSSTQRRVADIGDEDLEVTWRSGALGTLYCMQAALPLLRARGGGSIVNFGSSTAVNGDATFGAYAMTKEAIRGLSRVAATEWGRFGIRVNVVCPTAMSPSAAAFRDSHPDAFERAVREIPLGRFGDPEGDIGAAVVGLVSDDFGYLTGATLMLGGGRDVQ